jgi:methionine-rich copper-binding protein CopC
MIAMGFSASRAVCALVFLASTMMTPSVLAHAHLKQQIPAADSVVSAPQALTLNFSEGIEPGFSGVVVTDAQKQVIKTGTATRDERTRRSSPFRWNKRWRQGLTR